VSLYPSLTKPFVQYEIGEVFKLSGSLELSTGKGESLDVSSGQKVHSKESFVLGEGSSATFILSGEKIEIVGPAKFDFEVISPESQEVFVNLENFQEFNPKDGFDKLNLTYTGWTLEPSFTKKDLESAKKQDIDLPAINNTDVEDAATPKPTSESVLDELIASKRSLLKRCYENYLRKNPLATGELVVEFTLQNSGKVSSSRVKDSSFFKDETFKSCVQDVFKRIKTSPFEGDSILVTYPIQFE
jgi:TonB family protein